MDPASLAATVRNAVFASTQFRAGYDEGTVDDFLDELVRAVEGGASGAEVAAMASNAQFTMTSMQRGYECGDVDTLLDEVVRQASGEDPTVRTPAPPTVAGTHGSSSASPESSGLGARLLRVLRGN